MQKYVYLKLNPGKLITGEMFSKIRNTNYLGDQPDPTKNPRYCGIATYCRLPHDLSGDIG